jgi:chromosome segregation ATPase
MAIPVLRNLGRTIGRQFNRLRLVLERRKLERLETSLGLLGWQQADYDHGTQQHADRLTAYEREQARLTNESAQLGLQIVEIDERRGVLACEHAEALAATLQKEHPSASSVEELESQLAAKRKECRELEAWLAASDRELAEAEDKYQSLVTPDMPSLQVQAELQRWRRVIMAHPQEKADRTTKLRQATSEVTAMKALLESLTEKRAQFEKQDQELDNQVAALQRAKRKVEKQVDNLEKSKADPYREIGRALADQNIAPLNQPEALSAVLQQRDKIAGIEAAITASLAASSAENKTMGLHSWLAICGMIDLGAAVRLAIGGY